MNTGAFADIINLSPQGPDFVVAIFGLDRQRQPPCQSNARLPQFVTDTKGAKERQQRLAHEMEQKLVEPLSWLVTVETDGVLEVSSKASHELPR
jgi:hypothetical protein